MHKLQYEGGDEKEGYHTEEYATDDIEDMATDTYYPDNIIDTKDEVGDSELDNNKMRSISFFELPSFLGFGEKVFVGEPEKIQSTEYFDERIRDKKSNEEQSDNFEKSAKSNTRVEGFFLEMVR
jgi:hypothetical protein